MQSTRTHPAPAARPERGTGATVAICAYTTRRWDCLREAIASVRRQLRPGDEVLVVIDHNAELLTLAEAEYAAQPDVRVVASTGPRGLSGARNTAIGASAGDPVFFLDDDAIAAEGWLERMCAVLAEPDVLGVGSAARPRWPETGRPAWFPPEFDWVVGCSYVGMPTQAQDVRNVIGAGMAFRAEVFDIAGNFSQMVGRLGTAPTGCEETELCIRLRHAKPEARITYLPDAWVDHVVTPDRLRVKYFLRRCYGEGRSKGRVSRLVGSDAGLSSERSYVRSVLPRAVARELGRGLRGRVSGFLGAWLIVTGVFLAGVGYLRERAFAGNGGS